MILIKTLSRKTASFSQLINYINQGRNKNDEYAFRYNLYSLKQYSIIKEYKENYKYLKKQKNSNALYHDIIALKRQDNLTTQELREILEDLIDQYSKSRANYNLVYSVIHEKETQVHCHFVISSNEFGNVRNKRWSKRQLAEIQERLREYAYAKYPKLEREVNENSKTKSRAKTKTVDNEIQYKKRTGKQTDRKEMKERLQEIFAKSQNQQSFMEYLQAERIQVYKHGNNFGFINIATGKKYRVKTLELEAEFQSLNTRLSNQTNHASNTNQAKHIKTGAEEMNAHYEDTPEFSKAERSGRYIHAIRDRIKKIIETSTSYNEFIKKLRDDNFEMYKINDTFGFYETKTKYKYRLETLSLKAHFSDMLSRPQFKQQDYDNTVYLSPVLTRRGTERVKCMIGALPTVAGLLLWPANVP